MEVADFKLVYDPLQVFVSLRMVFEGVQTDAMLGRRGAGQQGCKATAALQDGAPNLVSRAADAL